MTMGIALCSCVISGINICPNSELFDLEYADDVVLPDEDSFRLQVLLERFNDDVCGEFCE